jgi:hypothetical protein
MARINEPSGVSAVLSGLAAMSGQQLVVTTLAEKADVARATVERYTELLDAVFLIHRLRPWSRNPLAQAVRRPKVHLVDTGLPCHLLHVNELRKQATWAETDVTLRHFRDSHGNSEVDVIAETPDGQVDIAAAFRRPPTCVARSPTTCFRGFSDLSVSADTVASRRNRRPAGIGGSMPTPRAGRWQVTTETSLYLVDLDLHLVTRVPDAGTGTPRIVTGRDRLPET